MTRRDRTATAELVPVIDRYLWMLGCRSLITVFLTVFLVVDGAGTTRWRLIAAAAGWLVLSYAVAPAVRRSRRTARIAFTLSLLGDAALLSCGWWLLTGPVNGVSIVITVHILGATLLASFRTGVKLALWYSVLTFLIVESAAAGALAADGSVTLTGLSAYLGSLWLITVLTAGFAAVNERELRRRRYDSEVLRLLGLDLNRHQEPAEIVGRLVAFARDAMLGRRVAVLAYPAGDGEQPAPGFGRTAGPDGEHPLSGLRPEAMDACVRDADGRAAVRVRAGLDAAADPRLAGLLPDAGRVVLIPFAVEQARGVVAVELTGRRGAARVERRVVAALHQATLQAGMALSRELLSLRLREMAENDALTGLANRGTFNRRLARALLEARADEQPFALIIADLDHFKRINDTHGHQAGDAVLTAVAGVLTEQAAPGQLVARFGGEEFAVILPGLDHQEAFACAERLRRAVAAAPGEFAVTTSVGMATFPLDGADGETLLAAADAALYWAKEHGRDVVGVAAFRDGPAPAGRHAAPIP